MDRLVKIILLIIGLSVLFLWISKSFLSCSAKPDETELETSLDDQIPKEELFEADEIDYTTTKEDDEAIPEEIEEDAETAVNEPIDFTTPPPVKKQSPRSTSSGNYMIIAGNYLIKANAEAMTKKLHNLGYSGAEIGVFDNSKYHTVIAARYNSYEDATDNANTLKRKGIDCYVKKRS